ncbi:MAG TPA: glycosyltransferase family 4 protein [Candidatus Cloacimonadota bacterium]|jgi:glycosyltransferase involved in cell wall biosynthesis|nr:glycosyltransferase family 4 protein [Candidatus Cloacimonadota bacterium]HOR58765.1 glycosyltransferase family 4 protein [Candidatus Cloacimonadota bacterium]HQL13481.1 glycosyltransferase family 4 protein [Candidatus Cloacimonadota bacterium]HQO44534.1 glycosyltransferase family 4 protein [Candidatus Cloacimonadota bacterium]HQP17467.1 glycosyltransferase family 4 protein [Candidatus Cloacimonadota bacterium]
MDTFPLAKPNPGKILYISYHFPPLGGIASIRAQKNVVYLHKAGYDIQVLTVSPFLIKYQKDPLLLAGIPVSIKVHRAFCPDVNWIFKVLYGLKCPRLVTFLRQNLFIPDPEVLWLPFAKASLRRLLRGQVPFSAAVVSSGPPSSLFLGLYLKRRYQIPFIIDFRDEWTNNPERLNIKFPRRTQKLEMKQELKVLTECSGVAYLTEAMQGNFQSRYPFLTEVPSAILPNGFDPSDFSSLSSKKKDDAFHLAYFGSFYDRRQPDSLWSAISSLLKSGAIPPHKIRVDIFGKNTKSFVLGKFQSDQSIRNIVNFHGFVSQKQALSEMLAADALLLYIPSGQNTDSVFTGKIFEYLGSGKPILAIVPPQGIAAQTVLRAKTGLVADYMDISGIAANLKKLYDMWETDTLKELAPDTDYVATFTREKLAAKLAGLIYRVVSGKSTDAEVPQ